MSAHKKLPESRVLSMAIDAGLAAERISVILDFAARIQRAFDHVECEECGAYFSCHSCEGNKPEIHFAEAV